MKEKRWNFGEIFLVVIRFDDSVKRIFVLIECDSCFPWIWFKSSSHLVQNVGLKFHQNLFMNAVGLLLFTFPMKLERYTFFINLWSCATQQCNLAALHLPNITPQPCDFPFREGTLGALFSSRTRTQANGYNLKTERFDSAVQPGPIRFLQRMCGPQHLAWVRRGGGAAAAAIYYFYSRITPNTFGLLQRRLWLDAVGAEPMTASHKFERVWLKRTVQYRGDNEPMTWNRRRRRRRPRL